jgi:hypothetical protein
MAAIHVSHRSVGLAVTAPQAPGIRDLSLSYTHTGHTWAQAVPRPTGACGGGGSPGMRTGKWKREGAEPPSTSALPTFPGSATLML